MVYDGADAAYTAATSGSPGRWTAARATSCSASAGGSRRGGQDHLDGVVEVNAPATWPGLRGEGGYVARRGEPEVA